MGFVQRVRDLNCVLERLVERQRTLLQAPAQRLPFQVLHHQEVNPAVVADVVKDADVRVLQRRDRARFPLEPLLELRIVADVLRKDLQGDGTVQARVSGFVHLAHTAGADGGKDFVRSETGAWTE